MKKQILDAISKNSRFSTEDLAAMLATEEEVVKKEIKEMEDAKVIAAVKGVYAGMNIFGGEVYQTMRLQMAAPSPSHPAGQGEQGIRFTKREQELLKLVAQGYDNKEIAAALYLAEGTVRNQISRLLEKLSLKDRTQLAVYAVKHGLD